MKHVRLFALIAVALLLSVALLLPSCDKKPAGEDTTVEDTAADTPTDTPAQPTETQPDTEAETAPPADLTADELKTLLAAALARETGDATVSVKTSMGGAARSIFLTLLLSFIIFDVSMSENQLRLKFTKNKISA